MSDNEEIEGEEGEAVIEEPVEEEEEEERQTVEP